jgi:hypothetical protein
MFFAPEEQYVYRIKFPRVPHAPEERYVVPVKASKKIIDFMKWCPLNIESGTTYCS